MSLSKALPYSCREVFLGQNLFVGCWVQYSKIHYVSTLGGVLAEEHLTNFHTFKYMPFAKFSFQIDPNPVGLKHLRIMLNIFGLKVLKPCRSPIRDRSKRGPMNERKWFKG